jgi:hypothetical protein
MNPDNTIREISIPILDMTRDLLISLVIYTLPAMLQIFPGRYRPAREIAHILKALRGDIFPPILLRICHQTKEAKRLDRTNMKSPRKQ